MQPPPPRQTHSHVRQLLEAYGVRPRHDLGQNFLIDLHQIDFIATEAQLGPGDVVLEVGTGTGGLTGCLCERAAHVITVDVDPVMHQIAAGQLAGWNNVTFLLTDALKNKNHLHPLVLDELQRRLAEQPGRQLKLVANLPYSAATPVISNLIATDLPLSRMVVTIQYELAERMQAAPGSGMYGALSVWLQSQCDVSLLRKLGPTVFWPKPGVDSAIVLLTPSPERAARITQRAFLQVFVRGVFTLRRKSLRGVLPKLHPALSKSDAESLLTAIGRAPEVRAEELDVPTFVELANRVWAWPGIQQEFARQRE